MNAQQYSTGSTCHSSTIHGYHLGVCCSVDSVQSRLWRVRVCVSLAGVVIHPLSPALISSPSAGLDCIVSCSLSSCQVLPFQFGWMYSESGRGGRRRERRQSAVRLSSLSLSNSSPSLRSVWLLLQLSKINSISQLQSKSMNFPIWRLISPC